MGRLQSRGDPEYSGRNVPKRTVKNDRNSDRIPTEISRIFGIMENTPGLVRIPANIYSCAFLFGTATNCSETQVQPNTTSKHQTR